MDSQNETLQKAYWKKVDNAQLVDAFSEIISQHPGQRWGFLCIGSDMSTGDALGPLVGSALKEAGYLQVMGSLHQPLDASNLAELPSKLSSSYTYLAIDAALGLPASVGYFQISNRPLVPGKSVGKKLPPLGHYSIAAIVNESGPRQVYRLQTTSLYRVMTMANQLVTAIRQVFPLTSSD